MNARQKISWLASTALIVAFAVAPNALAADVTDIGYLDQGAIGALPQFRAANLRVAQYKQQLDAQFAAAIKRARSDADRQRIAGQFQQKFIAEQQQVVGPLFARAQRAIAQASSNKNLSVIVDKRIVIFGGQDITQGVIDLVRGPGDVVPPTNTPAPSEVGFVDQQRIDQIPKIKSANDDFLKYAGAQRRQLVGQMQAAKNDRAKQQQLLQATQKTIADKQDQLLKPLVDQTRNAMADVAKKKNLILVVDRQDIIYGGTDITQDVQSALK
ncbi:MAG: OmpH family outer membrane protein [Candidatus Eremiobacteraeota bacterium]|nr:OmpH family outer membrane protein [Candidatus Eremiobacteraeota bacterium]